jgi:hypothetical protein
MAANTIRENQEAKKAAPKTSAKGSIFSLIEKTFSAGMFAEGLPVKYLPHILWVSFLIILYIANAHYAEKTTRKIDKMKLEVEDLRADFTTQKSEYMYASKQSEVARKVLERGLTESKVPPVLIDKTKE